MTMQAANLQALAEWQDTMYAIARSWVENFSKVTPATPPVTLPHELRRLVISPEQYLDLLENNRVFARRLLEINQAYLDDVADLVNETRANVARTAIKAGRRPALPTKE